MSCVVCDKPCNTATWNGIAIPAAFPTVKNPEYINFCSYDCRVFYLELVEPEHYEYIIKGDPKYKEKKKK